MANLVERLPDGSFQINQVVIFSCGCGSVVPDARNKVRMAGAADVPIVMTSTNNKAMQYIKQIGLDQQVPSLRKSQHSVLYNPHTGQYVDLLKSPQTQQVYENIFNVVRGQ